MQAPNQKSAIAGRDDAPFLIPCFAELKPAQDKKPEQVIPNKPLFSGWSREGYWSAGILFNRKPRDKGAKAIFWTSR